ncbi:MAG: hypothetical protein FJZ63_04245 [Chlamydiae bacterium]|nr:hypothetical protein [Chlamydiota bacterium]
MSVTVVEDVGYATVLSELYPYDLWEQEMAGTEHSMNLMEKVPLIHCAVGLMRTLHGMIQVISGIARSIFSCIRHLVVSSKEGFRYQVGKNLLYTVHGTANIFRGLLQTLIVGYPIFLVYDLVGARFRYSVESTGVHYVTKPYVKA